MEASLIRWIDFKVAKLKLIRQNVEAQMKPFVDEIQDLDYEIAILEEAKLEGSFMNPP